MQEKKRILIVDDNKSIHDDFKKILMIPEVNNEVDEIEQILFNEEKTVPIEGYQYVIDDAYQGEEAIEMVENAEKEAFPYSLIYMDVRMPPGIDGVQAIEKIWKKYPNIEMVICSAYSDYSWDDILQKFGQTDKLLFVKKPFNIIVIKQLTLSLVTKWDIAKKNREYMKHLEKEVEERTKELKKLLKHMTALKEKAEESEKMKSAFLANMSHEIRSPMNSILGFTQLLANDELDKERKMKYIDIISNSGNSLLKLINDIIDVAKIEAGALEIELSDFDVNDLFKDLHEVAALEKRARLKDHLEVVTSYGHKFKNFIINSDYERLKQVIINLLTNAIKFTENGTIKMGYRIEAPDWIVFFVEDTGIGIPKDKAEAVFNRFEQVNNSYIKKSSGTGLGLTISKNIVELLGGRIWVESEPNKGSKFQFTIPLRTKSSMQESVQDIEKNNDPNLNLQNKKILIAEDEKYNLLLVEQILKLPGLTLISATNGLEAVKIFEKDPDIDLILMDIRMPVMDGIEAISKIREINSNIPVIAQTAFALQDEEVQFRKQGFDDYIRKPIKSEELIKKVEYWLSKSKSQT